MQGNKGKTKNELLYENLSKLKERIHKVKLTILWNEPLKNDRNIPDNKPDVISHDHENGTCMLLHPAISGGGGGGGRQKYDKKIRENSKI
jgi:hypothetical protein